MSIKRMKPLETMMIYKEPVSPERAKELLEHRNPNNRTLSKSTIQEYSHDMSLGKWDESAINPIVFDRNEILRNGEHRLTAIPISGRTINLWFAYDAESSDTFDTGLKRTVSAVLKMRGINATTNTVAIIRAIGSLCFGVQKVSSGEIEKAIQTDGNCINEIYRCATKGGHVPVCKYSAVVAALYCAHKCGVSIKTIESFAKIVNTGIVEELGNNAPVVLRSQIMNIGSSSFSDKKILFQATQEAIRDFAIKKDRSNAYTGKTAYYASQFVDGFRNGTIYKNEEELK